MCWLTASQGLVVAKRRVTWQGHSDTCASESCWPASFKILKTKTCEQQASSWIPKLILLQTLKTDSACLRQAELVSQVCSGLSVAAYANMCCLLYSLAAVKLNASTEVSVLTRGAGMLQKPSQVSGCCCYVG